MIKGDEFFPLTYEENIALVVYRDFGDGSDEIGVLTYENNGWWVEVGGFNYWLAWNKFDFPFTIIGVL